MKVYEVGGTIRDRIIGVDNKDRDFSVVIEDMTGKPANEGFAVMHNALEAAGYIMFLQAPDVMTIRAKFPKGHMHEGQTADFVMARQEVYVAGSRRPSVVVGTLEDDIFRRDFTINALAVDENGNIIDMVGGIEDINNRILRTPLDTRKTFTDDPLRALRAIRFAVTKNFKLSSEVQSYMFGFVEELIENSKATVSAERIREELQKAFKHDSIKTIRLMAQFDERLMEYWLTAGNTGMWLMPTFKQ